MRRLLAFLACAGAFAEKPSLDHLHPAAAAPGTTNAIALSGKYDPWPPKAWSNRPELRFEFPTNKHRVTIIVPTNTPAGPAMIRLYNDDGASDPRVFIVDASPQSPEIEPNNHFRKPQPLANLPITINGNLDRNDVDSYTFPMRAGQWLDASLDCYTLMSKIDGVLRLVSTNGFQLAWNHDFSCLDPRLIWRAPSDQTVVLQVFGFAYPAVSAIELAGGAGGVYRLHASLAPPEFLPECSATNLALPGMVTGAICPAGNEDRYRFHAAKDQFIELKIDATDFGSPLDAWLKIEDASGKELARNDDADATRDPRLEWKAPADTNYFAVVGSVTHRGATNFTYRLVATPLAPDYTASVDASSWSLVPGSTNQIKVNLKRLRNFTNELAFAFRDLPEGVSATSSGPEFSLVVTTNAAPFNGPIRLIASDQVTKQERPVPFNLISRSVDNGVPGGYTKLLLESTDTLWLTVKPAAK